MNSAAHIEIADHGYLARPAGGDQIVENLVGDRFMKRAFVAVRPQIELEGFEFDAKLIGHVGDANRGEVRLAGPGADTGKLGTLHIDFKVALRPWVGKGL